MKYFVLLMLSCLSPLALPAWQRISNPVLDKDFPDPTVIRVGDLYYGYATNSGSADEFRHIQVASSPDLEHWTELGDALPVKPGWADRDFWAPHVLYDSVLHKYVLFYSGESKSKKTGKCLGVAFSDHPAGPFTDKGTPLLSGAGFVNIDPFAFIDPKTGKKLLYWGSGFQPIKVREMTDDWTSFKAGTTALTLVWPGQENAYDKLIEGAWVDRHDGYYYLYYSGDNCCGEAAHYAVMVARATEAMGPFTPMAKARGAKNSVILEASDRWLAPGHNSVVRTKTGKTFIAYHAIAKAAEDRHGRVFCMSPLRYENGWPVVGKEDPASSAIHWEEEVTVSNIPVPKDSDTSHNRLSYGSEYGRMLRLDKDHYLAAYTVSRNKGYQQDSLGGYELEIAESFDRGRHWNIVGNLSDPGRDLDNAEMIQSGDHTILLACRSVRWQESYRLPVYQSQDGGRSWRLLSEIDRNEGAPGALGNPDKGVYEPHLQFLGDGRLSVMYANEKHVTDTDPYSQIISQKISPDLGRSWGAESWVAYQPGNHTARPGMPVWTKMHGGGYIMVYEVCGPEKCQVYQKTSADGTNWPRGLGTPIPDQSGGPFVLSLSDGRVVVSSNRGTISISGDGGKHWTRAEEPWHHTKPFDEDWTQTIWSSLYQTAPDEIAIMTTIQRPAGGHQIRIRFGKLGGR